MEINIPTPPYVDTEASWKACGFLNSLSTNNCAPALRTFPDEAIVKAGPKKLATWTKPVINKNEVKNKQILKNLKIINKC